MGRYLRPAALAEALDALARDRPLVLAGGTDFYPARVGRAVVEDVLDITAIPALRGIEEREDHWRIGALATWRDLLDAALPPLFDGLKAAAREVGGPQVQNAGTLCGNLCNASPAADGPPNLQAMGASVELASRDGVRRLPVEDFITGNRATLRRDDELMTAILVPKPRRPALSAFLKLGARRYLVISIVMVAAVIERDGDRVAAARVSVGAAAPTARRLPALEKALIGRPLGDGLGAVAAPEHLAPLSPIDDVRATAAYRRDAALTLVRRALDRLATGGEGATP